MTQSRLNCVLILVVISPIAVGLFGTSARADYNPFASQVIDISLNPGNTPDYLPAPGQFINEPCYMDTSKALGPPVGRGTLVPSNSSVVSLGGFGGQIVLAFDHDVEDNPANPMGLDAIVFSNASWISANPNLHWSEPATIEIMPELNGNAIPGDDAGEKWYLIAGSDLTDGSSYRSKNWQRTGGTQPANSYPTYTNWPDDYNTASYELFWGFETIPDGTAGVVVNPNYKDADPSNDSQEAYWGYAEFSPTLQIGDRDGDNSNEGIGDVCDMQAELFYTNPDDPMTVGITTGSGGGDGFDIKWAVDQDTWQPANLSSFRYIRLTNATELYLGSMGEVSPEIDAVADVRPIGDTDGDGDVDFGDLDLFTGSWLCEWDQVGFDPAADLNVDNKVDLKDYCLFAWGWASFRSAQ